MLITTFFIFESLDASVLSAASLSTSKTDWFGTNNGGDLNPDADAFCTISSREEDALFATPVTAFDALL